MGKQFKKTEHAGKDRTIFDYSNLIDKEIEVHFSGGRQITGVLKGYDQVANLVIDNTHEMMKDNTTRELGLIIVRGPNVK